MSDTTRMRLCDVNIWLALTLSDHALHVPARTWWDSVDQPRSVAFCRPAQQGLLRLLTTAAVLRPYGNEPLTNQQAWEVSAAFAADERIVAHTQEPPGLDRVWRRWTDRPDAAPKLWMDAYLAAYAQCAGMTLVTTDHAFAQFEGLDVHCLG